MFYIPEPQMQAQIILPLSFIFCQECVELRGTIHLLHTSMVVYHKSFLHFHILAPDTKRNHPLLPSQDWGSSTPHWEKHRQEKGTPAQHITSKPSINKKKNMHLLTHGTTDKAHQENWLRNPFQNLLELYRSPRSMPSGLCVQPHFLDEHCLLKNMYLLTHNRQS